MNNKVIESSQFEDITVQHLKNIIKMLISDGDEFSIITRQKNIKLEPELNLFEKNDNFIKFDLIGYSFETSEIIKNDFVFRAGFGQDSNVKESQVSLKLSSIHQIIINQKTPIFNNFSNAPEKAENGEKDRSKLFLSKNKDIFKN